MISWSNELHQHLIWGDRSIWLCLLTGAYNVANSLQTIIAFLYCGTIIHSWTSYTNRQMCYLVKQWTMPSVYNVREIQEYRMVVYMFGYACQATFTGHYIEAYSNCGLIYFKCNQFWNDVQNTRLHMSVVNLMLHLMGILSSGLMWRNPFLCSFSIKYELSYLI